MGWSHCGAVATPGDSNSKLCLAVNYFAQSRGREVRLYQGSYVAARS